MRILSSYLLDEKNNRRIAEAAGAAGAEFIPAPEEREERIAQLDREIGRTDILLGGRLSPEQWRKAERLRWIHVPWAGVNSLLEVEEIRRSDLPVTNASGVMSDAVADQVMAYILMLARDLPRQMRAMQGREWLDYPTESPRRRILRGSTIGILGYGAIGGGVARRARAFGMRVAVMRHNPANVPPDVDMLVGPEGLHEVLDAADYLVVTLPLSRETRGLLGEKEFRRMKQSAYLINIARGAVVQEDALVEALRSGEIAGAALDVFEKEPLPEDSPLWEMPNVILTPHSSGGFQGFWDATVDLFLDNLDRFLNGRPLRNRVEPERGY